MRKAVLVVVAAALVGVDLGIPASAVSGGTTVPDAQYPFLARVFSQGAGCTGALVNPEWVISAASCFPGNPNGGAPAKPTTVTVGNVNLGTGTGQVANVTTLVRRTDRDVTLARLDHPIFDVPALALSNSAPGSGEALKVAGFGRTTTEWVPDRPKTATFSVTALAATTTSLSGQDGVDTCKGDAGGPVFREVNGAATLVAISSTSWQHGCLEVSTTQQGSTAARTDDIADWIRQNSPRDATQMVLNAQGEIWAKQRVSLYEWTQESGAGAKAVATNGDVQLMLDSQGQVWARQGIGMTNWTLESSPGVKAIAVGNDGMQMILDSQGQVLAKRGIGLFNWTLESSGGNTAIATNGDVQMVLNAQGEVWAKQGISLYNWTQESSPGVKAIAVGNDGMQMILDNQGQVLAKHGVGLFNWTLESSGGNIAIATNGDVQMVLNAQGQVWAKHGISLYNWTQESSPGVKAIAVANDGTQLILDNQGQVLAKREVSLFNWTLESSPGNVKIAIGFKVTN